MSQVVLGSDAASSKGSATQNRVLLAYAGTMFLGAVLLFAVQPMFAKIALPLLGGSPSVWNTAMVFFQGVLLLAYLYAHLSTRWLGARRQSLLHGIVLAVAFAALPIAAAAWAPPTAESPIPWLIGFFAASIGAPVFAVATTAPLLQRWFAGTDHPAAKDPYFLYGASNLGSLLALVAYPLVIERYLSLDTQRWVWSLGYGVLAVSIALSAVLLWLRSMPTPSVRESRPDEMTSEKITWSQRGHWTLLAFVPSSLLLGLTTHISTDIAATPLFWVVPLTLYLLTFVLVFARRPLLRHTWMIRLQPYVFILLAIMFPLLRVIPIWFGFGLNLLAFFAAAMLCHGELAKRRPGPSRLTEFYLWMSIGGVLGGMLNTLLAPVVFDGVYEYPIVLALACLLRPPRGGAAERSFAWLDLIVPATLFVILLLLNGRLHDLGSVGLLVFLIAIACLLLGSVERPLRFSLAFAAVVFMTGGFNNPVVDQERSFFGVNRIREHESGRYMLLVHGNTVHGAQLLDPARRREPVTYFSREGPLGQLFDVLASRENVNHVGVAGLGVGSVACYRRPGQDWTFFEIDPVVARMARDTRYFHFITDCAPGEPIVLGDARLSLARTVPKQLDLLILDAFSSDSVPVHLITREALALYVSKLSEDGVLAFNISNRYLDMRPILANLAADAGLVAWSQFHQPGPEAEKQDKKLSSIWLVMTRRAQNLKPLDSDARWQRLAPQAGARLWTDDYSNIVSAIRW